jgi:hypothetical protein
VVFTGTTKPPTDLTKIQIWLKLPDLPVRLGAPINSIAFVRPAFARPDTTFQISNVVPGPYQLAVTMAGSEGATWLPASAMIDGHDLLDGQTEITRVAAGTDLVITFSDRHTELSGTLQTVSGSPVSDVFVIACALERRLWGAARRVRAVRPDSDGHYAIKDLPPGDYLISGVTDVDQDEWKDPAFLDKLAGTAVRIAIAEGESRVLNLQIPGLGIPHFVGQDLRSAIGGSRR